MRKVIFVQYRGIFHKGITFPKRISKTKEYKDLYGIWYVSTQLGDLSEKALIELNTLAKKHPTWFKTYQKNLHRWMEEAAPLDWIKLEAQDPYGKLKKISFERLAKVLIQE